MPIGSARRLSAAPGSSKGTAHTAGKRRPSGREGVGRFSGACTGRPARTGHEPRPGSDRLQPVPSQAARGTRALRAGRLVRGPEGPAHDHAPPYVGSSREVLTFGLRWTGNDGTFEAEPSIRLPLGQEVELPSRFTPGPRVSTAQSLQDLIGEGNERPVHQVLHTIVAAEQFGAANHFTVASRGAAESLSVTRHFFHVLPESSVFHVRLDVKGTRHRPGSDTRRSRGRLFSGPYLERVPFRGYLGVCLRKTGIGRLGGGRRQHREDVEVRRGILRGFG